MRKRAGLFSPSLPFAVVLLAWQACSLGTDEVAARVNGEAITYADIERYEWLSGDEWPAVREGPRPDGWRLRSLRELVDQRILLRRAESIGLEAADAAVDEALGRRQAAVGTEDDLRRTLGSAGVTLDQFRAHLRRMLTVELLVSVEAASKVSVGLDEMREYFDTHEAAFSVYERQLRLAQILVGESALSPIPNLRNDDVTGRDAAREKIRWIQQQLRDGVGFEILARDYSEDPLYAATGGDMGFVPLSAMEAADIRLRRAVTALREGEQTGIVETDGEYRIMRLISIEEAGKRSFDAPDVQDAIRAVLRNRKEHLLREAVYEVERNRSAIRNYLAERLAEDPDASP